MRLYTLVALSLLPALTYAQAPVDVPNTFVSETKAKASEVNQNFEYLELRMNEFIGDIYPVLSGAGAWQTTAGGNVYLSPLKRLGVGTSNPLVDFHVNGDVRFQGLAESVSDSKTLTMDSLGNLGWRVYPELTEVANGSITTAKLASGAVTGQKVANGAIGSAHLNQMGATSGQVMAWNGSAWSPSTGSSTEADPTWTGAASVNSDISRIGNVQIGTGSSTNFKMHIWTGPSDGGLKIENSSFTSALKIINQASAGGSPLYISNDNDDGVRFDQNGNSSYAFQVDNDGSGHAVRINNSAAGKRALYVVNSAPGQLAGYFTGSSANVAIAGDLDVGGSLTKSGGTFKIDHPQYPESKYLYHSFVESPDMLNVYSGNVTTDQDGVAWVELPEYFEILNKDFRYQLTSIGIFSQAIVGAVVADNVFSILTDQPNVTVSWQVTGIRQDPWADANRVEPEVEKSAEEYGLYLHPELYGLSPEFGLYFERDQSEDLTGEFSDAESLGFDDLEMNRIQEALPRHMEQQR